MPLTRPLGVRPLPSAPRRHRWAVAAWMLIGAPLCHAAPTLYRCPAADGSVAVGPVKHPGCVALDLPAATTAALTHQGAHPDRSRSAAVRPESHPAPSPSTAPSSPAPPRSPASEKNAASSVPPVNPLAGLVRWDAGPLVLWAPAHPQAWRPTSTPAAPPIAGSVSAGAQAAPQRLPMFRVVHSDGVVEYTNIRPRTTTGPSVSVLFTYLPTCVACDIHSPIVWGSVALSSAYEDIIDRAAHTFRVDPALVRAVVHAESAFHPHAISAKGAEGLMQLMPFTARDMGVNDAFDPEQNIMGGTKYLAGLLDAFHGDERLAVAAYNAGPEAVTRNKGVPPYPETQVYVERVALLKQRYQSAR